ncbi:MAG: hypothetical protein ACLUE2_13690 [Bacteroides cellulosilyticus]
MQPCVSDTAARLDLLRSVANIGEGNDDFEGLIRLQKQFDSYRA